MSAKAATFVGVFILALSVALAGCIGDFETEHRVVIDDARGESVQVKEEDEEPQRIVVENDKRRERVDVEVMVARLSEGPATVLIKVVDSETEATQEERQVTLGDDQTDQNETQGETGNETGDEDGNETSNGDQEIVVIQNIDVRGKDNFVVTTQAFEGDADVEVKAYSSEGDSDMPEEDGNVTSG